MLVDEFWIRYEDTRKKVGISSHQLALKVGINENTMKQWKSKGRIPKAEELVKISRGLGVSIDFLLTGRDMAYNERVMDIAQACSRASEEDLQLVERILRIEKILHFPKLLHRRNK